MIHDSSIRSVQFVTQDHWVWNYGSKWDRIIAIGDIHGDLDGLLRIMIGIGVMDEAGSWIASSTLVVLIGDLNDRGPDSIAVISFVMELQQDAEANGGRVESLLGNHELLAAKGDYSYARAVEVLAMEEFRFDQRVGLDAFYRGASPYAAWIRSRPTIIKASDCVFVHAGLGDWARECRPEWVNATVAAWVANFQGVTDEPGEETFWLVKGDGEGPLWTTAFATDTSKSERDGFSKEGLAAVLDTWGARLVVAGHCPTRDIDYRICHPHPFYGDAVAVIDTGISRWIGGRLSAVELRNGSLTDHYFERGLEELPLTKRIRTRCEEERAELSKQNR